MQPAYISCGTEVHRTHFMWTTIKQDSLAEKREAADKKEMAEVLYSMV